MRKLVSKDKVDPITQKAEADRSLCEFKTSLMSIPSCRLTRATYLEIIMKLKNNMEIRRGRHGPVVSSFHMCTAGHMQACN